MLNYYSIEIIFVVHILLTNAANFQIKFDVKISKMMLKDNENKFNSFKCEILSMLLKVTDHFVTIRRFLFFTVMCWRAGHLEKKSFYSDFLSKWDFEKWTKNRKQLETRQKSIQKITEKRVLNPLRDRTVGSFLNEIMAC